MRHLYAVRIGRRWWCIEEDTAAHQYRVALKRSGMRAYANRTPLGLAQLLTEHAATYPTLKALMEDAPDAVRARVSQDEFGARLAI